MMRVDWERAWDDVQKAFATDAMPLIREFRQAHPEWDITAEAKNFPPRIEIECFLKPGSDKRRAEEYEGTKIRIKNVKDEEAQLVAALIAKIAGKTRFLCSRNHWAPQGLFRYRLQPPFGKYEIGDDYDDD